MSVLHLLGSAADGGAETYFSSLVGALARAGVEQACAIRRHPARQRAVEAAGVSCRTYPFGGPIDVFTKPQVRGFAGKSGARVLLAWMNRAAAKTPKGPWARIGRLGGYYSLKYYAGFDALVANTADIQRWVIEQGWPQNRVDYIPNFAAAGESEPQDRAALDTPEEAPLLLAMGRLHANKAHDVSLKALAQVPGAYLWIAGAGPLERELKGLAARLGVTDRVRFLGWREDATALYRAADICLFPSRFEPLGNVVIQCWAHGLPIVAAASQGPGALIRDGEDGLLAPVDDADALAAGVRRLLDDPMLPIRLIQNGHERVEAEYSEAAVVAHWRELFARYGEA
ncbi:MAG TPA: glycosyltransferase [Caulobacteraceae bacterium]|nr:glycosyltransferase [Caulobacteraceae bacterium]